MSAWAAEVKARGVADVAAALGLEVRPRDHSFGPCPACQAPRRHTKTGDPRGAVGLTRDGLGWRCFQCDASGDAVTLAALVALNRIPGKGDTGWREVAAFCEAHGLCTPSTPGAPDKPRPRVHTPPPPAAAPLPPRRPLAAELRDLWDRCHAVTEDAAVRDWLEGRHLDPALVAERDLARALPLAGPLPAWCAYRGASWRASSHRVIVPLYGAGGGLESLHARAVAPETPKDKAASPKDAEIRGLVMADAAGRRLLAGAPVSAGRVLVAEGVPDFLTWATHYGDAAENAPAVLGVIAGSWTPEIAATIPRGWTVIVRTHADAAGNKYAETIRASLAGRCECKRPSSHVSAYARIGVVHDA